MWRWAAAAVGIVLVAIAVVGALGSGKDEPDRAATAAKPPAATAPATDATTAPAVTATGRVSLASWAATLSSPGGR